MAIISLKLYNKDITQDNLQSELKKQSGHTASKVEDIGEGNLLVFFPCKRVYEVEKNGDVKYIGKEDEINEIFVIADKESDLNSKQVQAVKITVKRYNADENEKITIQYAWNQSKTDEPKTYKNASLEEGTTIAVIDSGEQPTGNYYLWIKVKVGNIEEIKRTYGEYYIQELTTLVSTNKENSAESGFLGNTDIKRGNIRSVTFTNSINGPTDEDIIYWNPSNKDSDVIQAWYTTEEIDGVNYYDVTIGQEGGVIANSKSTYLFAYIGNNVTGKVEIKGLENLDTSNVISMHGMFENCSGLKNLNVQNFDTSRVTNMGYMFQGCNVLESLDLSNFSTNSVTNMSSMFSQCSGLTSLEISNFNTSSVTSMAGMFNNCESLINLDVSNFNTSNVTNMQSMFNNCKTLTTLDVSKFDTSHVTLMGYMFYQCSRLTSLNVSEFNTSSVTGMSYMFYQCSGLTSLDVSNFNTSSVTNMQSMFSTCSGLTNLDVSNFNTSNVTSMYSMFGNCSSLTSLDVKNFDISSVTAMGWMFAGCNGLTSLDLRNWIIAEELSSGYIFNTVPVGCAISVSTQEMKDWVLSQKNTFTNVNIVDENGNIIESSED